MTTKKVLMESPATTGMSFDTGPDLPWQILKFRPNKLQMMFSRGGSFLIEEHEQMLEALATRLETVFALVLKRK